MVYEEILTPFVSQDEPEGDVPAKTEEGGEETPEEGEKEGEKEGGDEGESEA